MTPTTMLRLGAALAGLAVAAGAFGAHGLRATLERTGGTELFQLAVRYQMTHALAILICALLARGGTRASLPTWCFAAGIVLFSGSLYALAFDTPRWLGAITPFGGTLLIAGWVILAFRSL